MVYTLFISTLQSEWSERVQQLLVLIIATNIIETVHHRNWNSWSAGDMTTGYIGTMYQREGCIEGSKAVMTSLQLFIKDSLTSWRFMQQVDLLQYSHWKNKQFDVMKTINITVIVFKTQLASSAVNRWHYFSSQQMTSHSHHCKPYISYLKVAELHHMKLLTIYEVLKWSCNLQPSIL